MQGDGREVQFPQHHGEDLTCSKKVTKIIINQKCTLFYVYLYSNKYYYVFVNI